MESIRQSSQEVAKYYYYQCDFIASQKRNLQRHSKTIDEGKKNECH